MVAAKFAYMTVAVNTACRLNVELFGR